MKILEKDNEKLYQCEKCGLKYKDVEWVKKCEDWCTEHNSCNLDIITHAEKDTN